MGGTLTTNPVPVRRISHSAADKRKTVTKARAYKCVACLKEVVCRPLENRQRHCFECRMEKLEAQRYVASKMLIAKRRGLPPASNFACQDCGEQARAWDHRDYRKPLEVDAVCISCNLKRGPAIWKDPVTA